MGLNEISKYCVHQNISTNENIQDLGTLDTSNRVLLHFQPDESQMRSHSVHYIVNKIDEFYEYQVFVRYQRLCDAFRVFRPLISLIV
jgi:hypothetical protein